MNKTQLKSIKDLLLKEKARLEESLSSSNREEIEYETRGDDADRASALSYNTINSKFKVREEQKLKGIEGALKRVENKTYGVCIDCEEDIPLARLKASLTTLYCAPCQEEQEDQR